MGAAAWVLWVRAVAPLPGRTSDAPPTHLPRTSHATPLPGPLRVARAAAPPNPNANPNPNPNPNQDRSEWLEQLLREEYGGGAGAEAQLLGELQPPLSPALAHQPAPGP